MSKDNSDCAVLGEAAPPFFALIALFCLSPMAADLIKPEIAPLKT